MAQQLLTLVILAIPIASIVWTITHEELFSEVRNWCVRNSEACRNVYERKFFYLFTCEYCFSHYVTVIFLLITRFKLLMPGWRGYLIAGFALVWVANIYMSIFARLRLDIKRREGGNIRGGKGRRAGRGETVVHGRYPLREFAT